jgi:hypothetical protein
MQTQKGQKKEGQINVEKNDHLFCHNLLNGDLERSEKYLSKKPSKMMEVS